MHTPLPFHLTPPRRTDYATSSTPTPCNWTTAPSIHIILYYARAHLPPGDFASANRNTDTVRCELWSRVACREYGEYEAQSTAF